MKASALLATLVAAAAGMMAFVFIQFQDDGKPGVGVRHAEAACTDDSPRCLPHLTFVDTEGNAHTPDSLAGKIVIINVWATWCHPCQAEIPDLAAAYSHYKERGVVLLGVMTDKVSDEELAAFKRRYGINYPVVRADEEVMKAFEYPEALPTSFIYDRSGHARYSRPGAIRGGALDDILSTLIAE